MCQALLNHLNPHNDWHEAFNDDGIYFTGEETEDPSSQEVTEPGSELKHFGLEVRLLLPPRVALKPPLALPCN